MARRQFLIKLAVAAGIVAVPLSRPRARALDNSRGVAYRLSTAGRGCCNACRKHAANRYYHTREAANKDRPHAGCNCRIAEHPLPLSVATCYFALSDVYDRRWGVGTPNVQAPVCATAVSAADRAGVPLP